MDLAPIIGLHLPSIKAHIVLQIINFLAKLYTRKVKEIISPLMFYLPIIPTVLVLWNNADGSLMPIFT